MQSHLLFSYLSPPPEFETTTNKNFAQRSLWGFFSKNGAVLRKRLMRRALWGSETIPKPTAAAPARPQHPSPAQLLLQPSTRLASLTGTAASWHVLQEPSLRGREKKKKITTNVPPIMSHEAELLFLPCWILPFPWYFPGSGGSRGDAGTGQGSAGLPGDTAASAQAREPPGFKIKLLKVLFSSAPQAGMNLRRRRWSCSWCSHKAECGAG